jgi:hypothetical protein
MFQPMYYVDALSIDLPSPPAKHANIAANGQGERWKGITARIAR